MLQTNRLLIIDSDSLLVRCWRRSLQSVDLEVTSVTTLREARALFGAGAWLHRPYHYIFLDLMLSDGNGAEFFPFLQHATPRPRVAVIASGLDGRTALLAAGVADITVPKPLDGEGALSVLQLLKGKGSYRVMLLDFAMRHKLSERERQVVLAAVHGLNNDEIAAELDCDRSTVSTYWTRIFRKTNTNCQRGVLALIIRSSDDWYRAHSSGMIPAVRISLSDPTPDVSTSTRSA